VASPAGAHDLSQAAQPGLGGGVSTDPAADQPVVDRADVDDLSSSAFDHAGRDLLGQHEATGQVRSHHGVPGAQRQVNQVGGMVDAGVVNQDVNAAEPSLERADRVTHGVVVGHIEGDAFDPRPAGPGGEASHLGGRGRDSCRVPPMQDHRCARGRQGACDARPDATRRTGDEGQATAEVERIPDDMLR